MTLTWGVAEVAHQEDVLRLHVAVDDAARVSGSQRPTNLADDPRSQWGWDLADPRQKTAELLALQELADHVRAAVFGVVDVVDIDHVGVGDAAGRLGLALKARDHVGLPRELGVQHFDRETLVAEPGMARLVDPAHAAFAHHADDLVGIAERGAEEGVGAVVVGVDEGRGVTRADLEVGRVARLAGGARLGQGAREAPHPSGCRAPNRASPAAGSGGSSSWTRFGRVRHRGRASPSDRREFGRSHRASRARGHVAPILALPRPQSLLKTSQPLDPRTAWLILAARNGQSVAFWRISTRPRGNHPCPSKISSTGRMLETRS